MRRFAILIATVCAFGFLLPATRSFAQGQEATPTVSAKTAKPSAHRPSAEEKAEEAKKEKPVVTHHQITVQGKVLSYTATAGLMPIRDDNGALEAHMFYIAYTLDGDAPASQRPLTFCFNGGPGSSSVWLQLGAIGPRRVALEPDGHMPPPPFHLVDNQQTWLDQSDLVFIDPVGTGFSRAVKPEYTGRFWNVQGDIASVAQFIHLYLTRNDRWSSPLFLAGESYGTTRAAGLSGYLMDHGVALNGIVLVSTVLNFQTLVAGEGNELPFPLFLPSYAASAWYHKKLSASLESEPLSKLMPEVIHWVHTVYAPALAEGDSLGDAARDSVIQNMSKYTGLPAAYIGRANLRVDSSEFRKELLLDQGLVLGRYDTRMTGPDAPGLSAHARVDPSYSAVNAPFTEMFNNYVRTELNYKTDVPYRILSFEINRKWSWALPHGRFGYPNVAPSLRSALTQNPYLRVMVAEGYYDQATPFYEVEFSLNHLDLTPAFQSHVIQHHYESGHMIYIDTPSRIKLRQDVRAFMQQSLSEDGSR